MGLYNSFNPSEYYDVTPKTAIVSPPKIKNTDTISGESSKIIPPKQKKSLYGEAQEKEAFASKIKGPDFRDVYRVGQMVAIQSQNGQVRTRKGKIIEIVDRDLMYVSMEDTYKDVHGNWMVDFVVATDTVTKL